MIVVLRVVRLLKVTLKDGLVAGLLLLALTLIAPFPQLFAQSGTAAVKITHHPPQSQYLPYPGRTLELIAQLDGTKEVDLPLRFVAVVDGRLLDLTVAKSVWDYQDRPTYTFQIPAPQRELSYQFLLLGKTETLATSPNYRIRRTCLPDLEVVKGEVDESRPLGSQSSELFLTANKLDQELAAYERIYQLVKEIDGLLKD